MKRVMKLYSTHACTCLKSFPSCRVLSQFCRRLMYEDKQWDIMHLFFLTFIRFHEYFRSNVLQKLKENKLYILSIWNLLERWMIQKIPIEMQIHFFLSIHVLSFWLYVFFSLFLTLSFFLSLCLFVFLSISWKSLNIIIITITSTITKKTTIHTPLRILLASPSKLFDCKCLYAIIPAVFHVAYYHHFLQPLELLSIEAPSLPSHLPLSQLQLIVFFSPYYQNHCQSTNLNMRMITQTWILHRHT